MNTIVLKYNNFSNAIQSCWEKLYLKNPNLGIGGVHRWIQGGKWEGGAALRPTPNYEHEVAPPSSKTCNLKANFRNSIPIRFRVTFLRQSRERGTLFINLVSIQSKFRLCVLEVATGAGL